MSASTKPLSITDGAKKVTLQFQFGSSSTPAKVSFFAPVARSEFLAALTAVFPESSDFGAVEVDGEMFAITDKFINSVLLANSDKTYRLIGKRRAEGVHGGEGFDPSEVKVRLERLWKLTANFGNETDASPCYLNEIVSDRYCLVNGVQLLRDELQLASVESSDIMACGIDWSLPTVITTLAHTNCGDRIQEEATPQYNDIVGTRFATLAECGQNKIESFTPAGGGTDNGFILAHVTVAHQMDKTIREKLYNGNRKSYVSVNIDLMSHVGRYDLPTKVVYGRTKESPWREDRAACGAVIGTLTSFNEHNAVHKRIRSNLGEANFKFLTEKKVILADGTDITFVVAAAIVVVQGLLDTAHALADEMDERGVGHLTGTLTVNVMSVLDPIIYLARATVFQHEIKFQGIGTDASKYGGRMVNKRLLLTYDGKEFNTFVPHVIPHTKPASSASTHHHH